MPRSLSSLFLVCAMAAAAFAVEGPPYFDSSRSTDEQAEAAEEAAKKARDADAAEVIRLLGDRSAAVRDAAFEVLVERDDEALMANLRGALRHEDPLVRASVAELFGLCRYEGGRAPLERFGLRARDEETVLEAIWALEAIGSSESAKALAKLARTGPKASAFRAAGDALLALVRVDAAAAAKLADKALSGRSGALRIAAVEALGRIEPKRGAEAACVVLSGEPLEGREAAWQPALERAALATLARWRARAAEPQLAKRALESLLTSYERADGLTAHLCWRALVAATGESLSDAQAWRDWWSLKGAAFQPRDLGQPQDRQTQDRQPQDRQPGKKKGKKKKKKGKKKQQDEEPRPEEGRVETGGASATKVRFCGVPVFSRRLLFLQDTSGGMSRHPVDEDDSESPLRIVYSMERLCEVLGQLDGDARVNVLFFATRYRSLSDRLVPLGKLRDKLIAYVRKECRTPEGKGMTRSNLYDALVFALDDPGIDSVFFLSEGGQTEGRYVGEERLLRHLERLNVYRRVRVNCLQVTKKKKRARFLRELSQRTGGTYYPRSFLLEEH